MGPDPTTRPWTGAIGGVSPVLAVPFRADGALDPTGFTAVVDHVVGAGVSSCLLFGLASEFHKLSDAERDTLVAALVERTADRPGFSAICSVTDHATHLAVERARRYVAAGAGAINVLPPHFLGPSVTSVVDHLHRVLDAVDVPAVVQYAPAQTGTSLGADDFAALAVAHPNLTAVKVESIPPGPMIAALAERGVGALVGQAGVHLPSAAAAGAIGVQPGCSMVPLYQAMWAAVESGDGEALAARHAALLPVISHWMTGVETIVQAEKTVLRRLGIIESDHCRAPGATLDPYALALVDVAVDQLRQLTAVSG